MNPFGGKESQKENERIRSAERCAKSDLFGEKKIRDTKKTLINISKSVGEGIV